MLNINEIKKKLIYNPEPKEVQIIRDKIINNFGDIIFDEIPHKYYLDGHEMSSVSSIVDNFIPQVDWDLKATKKALDTDRTKEEVQLDWKINSEMACIQGNVSHEYGEMWHHMLTGHPENINDRFKMQYLNGYFYPASPKQEAIEQFNEDIFNIDSMYSVLAETKVYSREFGYAGTFDKLCYYQNKNNSNQNGLYILDYKTNKELENIYNRTHNNMMLPPFDKLIDEPLSHYYIQQSLYQIPLEDIGLKVISRKLIWAKSDGTYEKKYCPDFTKQLRKILNIKKINKF